jgi:hypothetical protein
MASLILQTIAVLCLVPQHKTGMGVLTPMAMVIQTLIQTGPSTTVLMLFLRIALNGLTPILTDTATTPQEPTLMPVYRLLEIQRPTDSDVLMMMAMDTQIRIQLGRRQTAQMLVKQSQEIRIETEMVAPIPMVMGQAMAIPHGRHQTVLMPSRTIVRNGKIRTEMDTVTTRHQQPMEMHVQQPLVLRIKTDLVAPIPMVMVILTLIRHGPSGKVLMHLHPT